MAGRWTTSPSAAVEPSDRAPDQQGPDRLGTAGAIGTGALLGALVVALVLVAGWHLTQGTSGVGFGDLLGLVTGNDSIDAHTRDILVGSRLPRLGAGLLVGFALAVAGALFQSLSRNPIASPDTLAVTAGSYLAVAAVAAFGLSVPLWASGFVAFGGGLAAAALTVALASGAGATTTRLILAGTAIAMALQALTATLLIVFSEETTGLFAWGSGSLSQLGLRAFQQAAPVVALATAGALAMSRRLDLMSLGDDTASVLGVPVRRTRATGTIIAVVLTATAVTLAGPIGFVGLYAPVIARGLGRLAPGLRRHAVLIPASGLVGALSVVLTDAVVRAAFGSEEALSIPTGVTTTIFGSIVLVVVARSTRDAGPTREPPGARVAVRTRRRFVAVVAIGLAAVAALAVIGLLAGQKWLAPSDLAAWWRGEAAPLVQFAVRERGPRIGAALVAGAALALAGSLVQATCRNPLAEPGLLGITAGAGLGAVIVVTNGTMAMSSVLTAAMVGALVAFVTVYALAWRGGLNADRLVLIGVGVWYGTSALSTLLLVRANPWDTPRIFTWLSGTTYGRTWSQVVPVAVMLAIGLAFTFGTRRELDLLAVDDDTPRLTGVGLERLRLAALTMAAVMSATAVIAVGVVGFVGLIAPHAARALVGGRQLRVAPVAALLGAVLLGTADTLGRTVIAPQQLPAGLMVALVGAPYFVYLLARSRA